MCYLKICKLEVGTSTIYYYIESPLSQIFLRVVRHNKIQRQDWRSRIFHRIKGSPWLAGSSRTIACAIFSYVSEQTRLLIPDAW